MKVGAPTRLSAATEECLVETMNTLVTWKVPLSGLVKLLVKDYLAPSGLYPTTDLQTTVQDLIGWTISSSNTT